jgi:hypothetical protein
VGGGGGRLNSFLIEQTQFFPHCSVCSSCIFGILIVRTTNHDSDIRMSIDLKSSNCITFKIEKIGHLIDFLAEPSIAIFKNDE